MALRRELFSKNFPMFFKDLSFSVLTYLWFYSQFKFLNRKIKILFITKKFVRVCLSLGFTSIF